MTPDTLYRLAQPLIVLQFAALGWRANRELNLDHAERGTFVLIPDLLNVMSLFAAVICLIVLPVATDTYLWLSRMVLAGGYALIAFYPLTTAAHYRLWSRGSIRQDSRDGNAYPYVTREEIIAVSVSAISALLAAFYVGTH